MIVALRAIPRALLFLSGVTLAACRASTGSEPPGPPTGILVASSVPDSVAVAATLDQPVAVKVVDIKGNPVPNAAVRWSVSGGFGSTNPTEMLTDAAGVAQTVWTMGTRSGEQRLTATILTPAGSATQIIVTRAIPGPAASISLNPSSLRLGSGDARQLVATARDAYGNSIGGRKISWSTTDGAVASVDAGGQVLAKSPGTAEIIARLEHAEGRATVSVLTPPLAPAGTPSALQFDGIDDYVQIADASSLAFGTGDFTWEVWLKRSRTSIREDVLSKKDIFADSEHDVVLLIEGDGRANAFLREHPHSGRTVVVSSETPIGTTWTHVALSRMSGIVRVYVNGVLEGTGTAPFSVSSNGPFRIGTNRVNNAGADAAPVFPFAGLVHEVRVWNIARTGAQIADGRLQCFAPGTAGLIAYYRFDEGSGTTLRDASGNRHTGSLRNGPIWIGGPPRCTGP